MIVKCPVCGGVGSMPAEFYNPPMPGVTSPSTSGGGFRETCRACGGNGVIVDNPPAPEPQWPNWPNLPTYPGGTPQWPPVWPPQTWCCRER